MKDEFQLAIDTIPALVWSALPDGHIDFLNRRWREYTGFTLAQASGWGWQAAIHPDDVASLVDYWKSVLASAQPGETVARLRRFDGAYRWFLFRAVPLYDESGKLLKWYGTNTDITDRVQAEAALKCSEERYALAMEAAGEGHFDWIVASDEFYASPRLLEMCGLPVGATFRGRADWLNQFPIHPEDRPKWESAVAAHFASKAARFQMEMRMLLQGETRWIRLTGLCLRDAAGNPVRWTGSIADITERKCAEAALRESEERFALAVAGSTDGVWDWDILTNQMFLSERAQRLYGLEPGVTVRPRAEWHAMITIHPDDAKAQLRSVEDYLAGFSPNYEGEWRVRHADGNYRWVRIRGLCVRDAAGRGIRMAGSVSDIDSRRRAEAALRQALRLEAIGTLAGGIAHDFNNILAAILGYGEMAMRNAPKGSRLRRDLDSIMSAGERGRALTERILAFSRSGVGERVPVHVEAVVEEALELIAAKLPDSVWIEARLEAGRAAMLGDPTQLHQVFMNLATNAVQAMSSGGTLRVSLETLCLDAPRVATTGQLSAGDWLVLTLADSGVGIPSEIIEHIFDPFFTTKEVGRGTGLGLSLVHGIVTELGGAVNVKSTVGAGTVFTVYLPRVGDAADDPQPDEPALPKGNRQRVLIVDDEEPLVRLVTESLKELEYLPMGFTSSRAALEAFRADPERFDAVITDESMPEMSGTALIRELRAIRSAIPVLLVSGYLGATVVSKGRQAGANQVLKKPLATRELATSLARVLQPE